MQDVAKRTAARAPALLKSKLGPVKMGAKNGFSKICSLETAHDASLEATERSTMEER